MESGLRAESVDLIPPPPKQHNKTAGFSPEFHSCPSPRHPGRGAQVGLPLGLLLSPTLAGGGRPCREDTGDLLIPLLLETQLKAKVWQSKST